MTTVITYGTYDLLHYGHIRLLERAKALGDYLIVGVTSDDFDKRRGKINVQQSLSERIEAVRATGLADKIIIEEYEGQKIDDICQYGADIFAIGSDWSGQFDYLNDLCQVVYLPRTEGISSTQIRSKSQTVRLGLSGNPRFIQRFYRESFFVNGFKITSAWYDKRDDERVSDEIRQLKAESFQELLDNVDAVYIGSTVQLQPQQIRAALEAKKHVICEVPFCLSSEEADELRALAVKNNVVLMGALQTAYTMAYKRMLLLLRANVIGRVVAVNATCTSLKHENNPPSSEEFSSLLSWGRTGLLPILQILGDDYREERSFLFMNEGTDGYAQVDLVYPQAIGTLRVGTSVKAEGELIISGTKGYIYVPAPWWKTDYFEVRFEHAENNRRYFYRLDGEGVRGQLVEFMKLIKYRRTNYTLPDEVIIHMEKILINVMKQENALE